MEESDLEAQSERQLVAALKSDPEAWTPDCLPPEQMIALAEGPVPGAEVASLMAHIALCSRCRREYAETVELIQLAEEVGALEAQAQMLSAAAPHTDCVQTQSGAAPATDTREPSSLAAWSRLFSPGPALTLGAVSASVALFLVWTLQRDVRRDEQNSKLISILKESDSRKALAARLEQENRELRQELTATQRVQEEASRLSKEVARLNRQVQSQGIQVARLTEADTALQQMPLPTPDWMRSQENGQSRGSGGTDTQSPEIVLIRAEAVRRKYAASPLTLGVLYAKLGMLSKAEEQFRSIKNIAPYQSIAKRWLRELQSLHSQSL